MRCRYMDAFGARLHEGDVVEVRYPGSKIKVRGIVEYSRMMCFWGVRVTDYYYPSIGKYVAVNPGAVASYVSLVPHARRFSKRLRGVRLLKCAETFALPLRPGIDFETPIPYCW